jgi:mannonate dehydratase
MMEQSFRWFGPSDVVPLRAIRHAGATGVVTSLHQIPYGEVWTVDDIEARKALIGADPELGLRWNVVESLPIHERVKIGEGDLSTIYDNYRASMRNLAACGVTTICYNFMPVIDWTRTELRHRLPGGATALRFNAYEFAAFDVFMLKRPGAEGDHSEQALAKGREWFAQSSESDRAVLLASIMAGLPGAFDRYDLDGLRAILARYRGMSAAGLRERLAEFLREVIPLAEELGMVFAIHPDDPPRPLFGLPRVVSSGEDLNWILKAVDSPANGICLCSGSLGAGAKNDPVAIARAVAPRIHFAHLRNVAKEPDGSFMEADHLGGDTDMVGLVDVLMTEQKRRKHEGVSRWRLPMRPDHGHELLDDVGKGAFPGYSAIGRLKGLAELRGVMTTLAQLKGLPM